MLISVMTPTLNTLTTLLDALKHALVDCNLHSTQTPAVEALNSQQPFAVDTLTFEQWLQFMFIPKMELIIHTNQPLPRKLAILPMAEEVYKDRLLSVKPVLVVLAQIDDFFKM